jgi:hypothetical protein
MPPAPPAAVVVELGLLEDPQAAIVTAPMILATAIDMPRRASLCSVLIAECILSSSTVRWAW